MPTPSEGSGASGRGAGGLPGEAEAALARSVLYAAVAAGLRRPDADARGRLAGPEARRALALAGASLAEASPDLAGPLSRVAGPPPATDEPGRYDALFGHTARGPVCAFETEYGAGDLFRQPQELAHIAGYYHAFGLRPAYGHGERVDHIACQCEFMAFLALKEACLLEAPDGGPCDERGEQLEVTRRASRDFLRDHLGRFGITFAGRLARADAGGPFAELAGLLQALLQADSSRLDAPLGPPTLDLRPPAVDPAPTACGTCPELLRAGHPPEP